MPTCKTTISFRYKAKTRRGIALVISLIFLAIFSAMSVTMFTISSSSVQMADNHHKSNTAMSAALSGMECAKYILARTSTFRTNHSAISGDDAKRLWNNLYSAIRSSGIACSDSLSQTSFEDSRGDGERIFFGPVNLSDPGQSFNIEFYRYEDQPGMIYLVSAGTDGRIARKLKINIQLSKDSRLLDYAVAGNNRIWVTQQSLVNGPVYSTWNLQDIGPGIKTEEEATVQSKIMPSPGDKSKKLSEIPGMKSGDYNTSIYKSLCTKIPDTKKVKQEYFPHAEGDYAVPKYTAGKLYDRKVYENKAFSNVMIPKGTHALFVNCTFDGVLFVETSENYVDNIGTTNNIRFEDCQFNGTIVSDVPRSSNHYSWWMRNVLYFTGSAFFDNQSQFPETTILAPNFNVNIGNTQKLEEGVENVLTGVIVGGIVDVRGNATINGTIISTYDASRHSNGYITNIGAADDDGTEGKDYSGGRIEITPDPTLGLPDGIKSAIVIHPLDSTYSEIL